MGNLCQINNNNQNGDVDLNKVIKPNMNLNSPKKILKK